MTIDELGAISADTETPTVTLSSEEAAAIAETYKDADEQRRAMAAQLRAANSAITAHEARHAKLQQELGEARTELARLRHENTELIRQNAALRRESNALIRKFARDLQHALGVAEPGPDTEADEKAGDELEDEAS